ncbi:hypothetical protein SSAG_04574, partial [Streptomyces sp. Mg1]
PRSRGSHRRPRWELGERPGPQAARVPPLTGSGRPKWWPFNTVREGTGPRARGGPARGSGPPAGALRALNAAMAAAPAHRELVWGEGLAAPERRAAAPALRLAAELAEAVAELLTDPRVGEVRECEGADCVLLFLPANPRRRWCVASACGNRARVARYYARHGKPGQADAGTGAGV